MSILEALAGSKINVMCVQVIEVMSPGVLIVGDSTGIVILKVANSNDKKVLQAIEMGKGVKILWPQKVSEGGPLPQWEGDQHD